VYWNNFSKTDQYLNCVFELHALSNFFLFIEQIKSRLDSAHQSLTVVYLDLNNRLIVYVVLGALTLLGNVHARSSSSSSSSSTSEDWWHLSSTSSSSSSTSSSSSSSSSSSPYSYSFSSSPLKTQDFGTCNGGEHVSCGAPRASTFFVFSHFWRFAFRFFHETFLFCSRCRRSLTILILVTKIRFGSTS
jgi:hypothetical protein